MTPMYQAGIGGRTESADFQNCQYSLMIGRVASPVSPLGDPTKFSEYIQYCLSTWTVDVVLDDGRYAASCRILVPQGNEREGFKRMFKFPRDDFSETAWMGDKVVVAFLSGNVSNGVVLGSLYPIPMGSTVEQTLDATAMENKFITAEANEWRDRHDVIDYTLPKNPLPAHTEERNSGRNLYQAHKTLDSTTGEPTDNTVNLVTETDTNGKLLEYEHSVESGAASARTTNAVYSLDDSALNLLFNHLVQSAGSLSSYLSIQDFGAALVQLFHSVGISQGHTATVGIKSTGNVVTLSHETDQHLFTFISDGIVKNFSLTKVDKSDNSNASISLHANSKVVVRRASSGAEDSWIVLDKDGTVSLQSSSGATVRLSNGRVSVKSGQSSVTVDDSNGIVAVSADGGMVSIKNGQTVVSANAVSVQAKTVALTAGAIRLGPTGTINSIPSTEKLYDKLAQLESRLKYFEQWAALHRHKVSDPPPTIIPVVGPDDTFKPDKIKGDSLGSVTGD